MSESAPRRKRRRPRRKSSVAAAEARRRREAVAFRLSYPEELPVVARRGDLREAIAANQVVVVAGETGSGKTTQLPKICLELGRGLDGLIGHTQPRRIAARSVATRLAEELESPLGEAVGYQIRFSDRVGPATRVKVMADGILLSAIGRDPLLRAYDTLIIDEAHERSLNIDFLLGYLKQLLPKRPDLKLIITSATIDTERFSAHFHGAPVVTVSGRGYPVEIRYRPPTEEDAEEEGEFEDHDGVLAAVDELAAEGPGDILVFFPTERAIREAAEALRKHHPPHTTILPLYSRQSAREQNRVFQVGGGRRIVLATNVAETSLTVPGIHYVVDTGRARVSRYSVRSWIQRLPIEPISRAAADQRAGRCGRIAPGICIRLYGEEDHNQRPAFTDPEIRRTNLASVVLRMAELGLGDVAAFPFLDPPEGKQINDAYRLLFELGAVDERRAITKAGRELARLPVDPRFGRILQVAREYGALAEALVIVSGLSIQDPRERPADATGQADARHAEFRDPDSDFTGYLKLWDHLEDRRRHLSRRRFENECRGRFLSPARVREWRELYTQLRQAVGEQGWRINEQPADYAAIHRPLLAGLLTHLAQRDSGREYLGTRGRRLVLFPGSGLKKLPKWLIAAELVETSKLFARTAARVEPEWVEAVGDHLLSRSYSDPHWERKAARVVAKEQVTLQGLVLVSGRRVHYGGIDPAEARRILIQSALVEGDYDSEAEFFVHNRRCLEAVAAMEDKARRRDLLVDEATLYAFYDARIPAEVATGTAFEKWRRRAEADAPRVLFLDPEQVLAGSPDAAGAEAYPDALAVGPLRLPLRYRFEPGHPEDGVTVEVPVAALNQLPAERFEWLVPGLLEERITALLRALPKSLRRRFVPVPDFARAALEAIRAGDDPDAAPEAGLVETLSVELRRMTGVDLPADAWDESALPDHLRMRFEVRDEAGAVVDAGRDLAVLRGENAAEAAAGFGSATASGLEEAAGCREGITGWDFGPLEEAVTATVDGLTLTAHPGLVDTGEAVALRLFDTPGAAEAASRAGIRRLYQLALPKEAQYLRRKLPGLAELHQGLLAVDKQSDAATVVCDTAFDRVFLADDPLPRDAAAFEARLARKGELVASAQTLVATVNTVLERRRAVLKRLDRLNDLALMENIADLREQLDHLVYPGFLAATASERLGELPRYLRAAERRAEKLATDPGRDRAPLRAIRPWWERWRDHPRRDEMVAFRWLLEEYRVALFAQELGTKAKVSEKRIAEAWKAV
ncbi:MAG: ATP-dependent RNA helicase HrpA [Thiohalospira sp.]